MSVPYSGKYPFAMAAITIFAVAILALEMPEVQAAIVQKHPAIAPFFTWLNHLHSSGKPN